MNNSQRYFVLFNDFKCFKKVLKFCLHLHQQNVVQFVVEYFMKKVILILLLSLSWALTMNQLFFNNQILNLHFLLNKGILKILNFKLKIIVETWYHKFTKVIHNHQLHSGSNLVYSKLLLKASKAIPRSLNGNVKSFPGQYFDGCNFMACHHTNFALVSFLT